MAAVVVPEEEAVTIEKMAKPKIGRGGVLVRMHAASLNSRDLVVAPACMQAVVAPARMQAPRNRRD